MWVRALLCLSVLAALTAAQDGLMDEASEAVSCEVADAIKNGEPLSDKVIKRLKKKVIGKLRFMTDNVLGKLKAATCDIDAGLIDEDVFAYVDQVHANIINESVAYLKEQDMSAVEGKAKLEKYPEVFAIVKEKLTESIKAGRVCICDHSGKAARKCMRDFVTEKVDEINGKMDEIRKHRDAFRAMIRAKRIEVIRETGLKPDNFDSLDEKAKAKVIRNIGKELSKRKRARRVEMLEKAARLIGALISDDKKKNNKKKNKKNNKKKNNKKRFIRKMMKKMMGKRCKKTSAEKEERRADFLEDIAKA